MFLLEYVGYKITIQLKENYLFNENGNLGEWLNGRTYFTTSLLGVDMIGIWVDWTFERTIIADEQGHDIDEPYGEEILHYFLLKWEYIESALAIDNPKNNENRVFGSVIQSSEAVNVSNELETATASEFEVSSKQSYSTKNEGVSTISKIKKSLTFNTKKKEINYGINQVLEKHSNAVNYLKKFYLKNNSHVDHELLKDLSDKVIEELKVILNKETLLNNEDMELYVKTRIAKLIKNS